jgi:chloride channel 7
MTKPTLKKSHSSFRGDSAGGGGHDHHHVDKGDHLPSLQYQRDESEAWRAHVLMDHYRHQGQFWNTGKHEELVQYLLTALIGITQGCVAYFTNLLSNYLIDQKFETVNGLLEEGHLAYAYLRFASTQLFFAALASAFVWIEPISAGSGIPEVKCYLNGIDLPNVGAPLTLICKVFGVICSVAAGLPVGKEGPMVHRYEMGIKG